MIAQHLARLMIIVISIATLWPQPLRADPLHAAVELFTGCTMKRHMDTRSADHELQRSYDCPNMFIHVHNGAVFDGPTTIRSDKESTYKERAYRLSLAGKPVKVRRLDGVAKDSGQRSVYLFAELDTLAGRKPTLADSQWGLDCWIRGNAKVDVGRCEKILNHLATYGTYTLVQSSDFGLP